MCDTYNVDLGIVVVNLVIIGQSKGQMSSSKSFSVKECSTKGHVHMFMTLKASSPPQKHHNMNP